MAQAFIGGKVEQTHTPEIFDTGYKHSIIHSKDIPQSGLLSMVSGTPVLLEYYRAALGADEEPQGFQPTSVGTYRSYWRIKNLIGKMDGKKNFSFDPEKGTSEDRYTIYLMYDVAPNIGDIAIMDIGAGRAGVFTIYEAPEYQTTDVEKCYRCEFVIVAVLDKEIFDILDSRVIKELYYNKDNLLAGGSAILTEEDQTLNKRLYELLYLIVQDVYESFFYEDEETIILPNTDPESNEVLYDPYLTKFLLYTIPSKYMGNNKRIREMNVNYTPDSRSNDNRKTVWDMFVTGDFGNPGRYENVYYTHSRNSMLNTRYYGNVFFSKIDRVINTIKEPASKLTYRHTSSFLPIGGPLQVPAPEDGKDHAYYFSKEFYKGAGTQTEQFVWKMFKDKTVDKKGLVEVLDGYWELPPMDRLYMSGIYMLAIKNALVNSSNYF